MTSLAVLIVVCHLRNWSNVTTEEVTLKCVIREVVSSEKGRYC